MTVLMTSRLNGPACLELMMMMTMTMNDDDDDDDIAVLYEHLFYTNIVGFFTRDELSLLTIFLLRDAKSLRIFPKYQSCISGCKIWMQDYLLLCSLWSIIP